MLIAGVVEAVAVDRSGRMAAGELPEVNDESAAIGKIGTTGGMKIEPGACSGTTIAVVGGATSGNSAQCLGSSYKPSVCRNFHRFRRRLFFSTGPTGTSDKAVSATSSGRVLAVSYNRFSRGNLSLFFVQKMRLPMR